MVAEASDQAREADKASTLAYRQRVIEVQAALAPMVDRLHNFVNGAVFESVSVEEQAMLKAQLGHMQSYLRILNQRIKFHKGLPE